MGRAYVFSLRCPSWCVPQLFKDNALLQLQNSLTSLPNSLPIVLCGDFNLPQHQLVPPRSSPSSTCAAATLMCDLRSQRVQLAADGSRNHKRIPHPRLVFTNIYSWWILWCESGWQPGTDHDAVFFSTNFQKHRPLLQKRWTYNFKKADFVSFRELLSKVPWDCCFLSDSINDCWISFMDLLLSVADQCVFRTMLRPKKRMHWLSSETPSLDSKEAKSVQVG